MCVCVCGCAFCLLNYAPVRHVGGGDNQQRPHRPLVLFSLLSNFLLYTFHTPVGKSHEAVGRMRQRIKRTIEALALCRWLHGPLAHKVSSFSWQANERSLDLSRVSYQSWQWIRHEMTKINGYIEGLWPRLLRLKWTKLLDRQIFCAHEGTIMMIHI